MKTKVLFLTIILFLFMIPLSAHAQIDSIFGQVKPPPEIGGVGDGAKGISTLIQRAIQIIYVIGVIGFIFMLLWSGLQMILNAGDKEATGNARKRITTAIIGITLLALAFPIMRVLEAIIGIKFFF